MILDPSSSRMNSFNPGLSQKPQTLLELSQKFPNEHAVIERLKLERHLTFNDYHCRAYIINRINGTRF